MPGRLSSRPLTTNSVITTEKKARGETAAASEMRGGTRDGRQIGGTINGKPLISTDPASADSRCHPVSPERTCHTSRYSAPERGELVGQAWFQTALSADEMNARTL